MMLRQQAFEGKKKMLKGGLHCHTTRSDGKLTPEEVIELHKENGYDFLAITDHRNYNFKNFAPESGLTIIPGMEFDNVLPTEKGFRCFHTVCLGHPKDAGSTYEQDQVFESGKAKDQLEYQKYLDEFHANKNLTLYCHPEWSSTPAAYFDKQKGNFAMEIWNSGSVIEADLDKDAAYWDELLRQGIKIYGAATDDGHQRHHHCKGWVMVNADNNDVESILQALEEGKFYSSCGPEIYDFYVEDGVIKIDCSPVEKIKLVTNCYPLPLRTASDSPKVVKACEDGTVTHGEYDMKTWRFINTYARAVVIDKEGRYAWSNPIFLD